MGVARIAVFAAELASPVRVDAVVDRQPSSGDGLIQNAPDLKLLEFDQMSIVGVASGGGHAGDSGRLLGQYGEERGRLYFRHLFAFGEMSIGRDERFVKCGFSTLAARNSWFMNRIHKLPL